jgi:hypothetical protein
VVGISSQPFWLFWTAANGKAVSHAPDYFVRRGDGSAVVLDCRPIGRRGTISHSTRVDSNMQDLVARERAAEGNT